MLDFPEILISLVSVITLLLAAIFTGFLLQRAVSGIFRNASGKLDLFWKLVTGTILLISFYAIWSAKGMTILFISPLLLFFFVRHKMMGNHTTQAPKQHLIFFVCSVILNFVFYLLAINSFSQEYVTYVSGDFGIYYRMAQQLNEFGIETLNLDPVYTAKHASPYHYGDIWMYALVSRFVSTNPSVVFLVGFTHFSIIFINGIYTFAYQRFEKYLGTRPYALYLLLLAGLFTGFNIFFPYFIIPSAEPYTLSVMNWSKVLVPSSFLICLLILGKNRNWWAFVLLAMIGGLSFINALPAIFMAVFLVLTVNALRKDISWKQWFRFHLCYVLITVVFVVFMYKVLPGMNGTAAAATTPETAHRALEIKQYLSTAIKIFIGGWFQLFVLTPFFIIFFVGLALSGRLKQIVQKIKHLDNDILFLVFMIFSGLACWAVLHPFAVDAVQFYTNVLAPVYAIAISFLAMYVLYVFRNKVLSVVMMFCLAVCILMHRADIFFVNKHDRAEWNTMTAYLGHKNERHSFVNFQPFNHFNSFFDKNTIYFMPLGYLSYLWPDYHNFSLNAPFIPVNESSLYADEERKEIALAPFTIYYKQEIKSGKTAEEIMGQFISDQHIGYISVSRDTVLPPYFRNLVVDSLVLKKADFTIYRIK